MSASRATHHHDLMSGVEGASANNSTPRSSSSPELSSPPHSLSDPGSPAAQQLTTEHRNRNAQLPTFSVNQFGVDGALPPPPPARKKPGRKPGSTNKPKVNADGTPVTDAPKIKRPRKPRDPNAPPIQRKKKGAVSEVPSNASSASSKMTSMSIRPSEPGFQVPPPKHSPVTAPAPLGKSEDIHRPINSFFTPAQSVQPQQQSEPPPPPPPAQPQPPVYRSSGHYDPVRSNYDPVRETMVNNPSYSHPTQSSPKYVPQPANRASASPSISSLVDPPNHVGSPPSVATQSFFSQQQKAQSQAGSTSVPPSPTPNRTASSPMLINTIVPAPQSAPQPERQAEGWLKSSAPAQPTTSTNAGFVASIASAALKKQTSNLATSTTTSSTAPSPKPSKTVDVTPPPLPGSGSLLGPKDGTESRAPTIVLHIPLNGETNRYVNFSRLAEESYGWEALHPRLAAQRERLARVAAAGAALEKAALHRESGDDMSLDLSEGEGEGSNVEMGGMSDGKTGTDGGKKPVRKRKMKEDEYDKDDGFVDDSEMIWEEQAAASKDGFFVYSGPLVPEGEKPTFDRGEGPPKRGRGGRGRGRGRGRGASSLGGEGSTREGSTTGGGPGSRGGNVTRKPRITKADRERMAQEKAEREKLGALAAKTSSVYGGMSQLATTANIGGTPMVFN